MHQKISSEQPRNTHDFFESLDVLALGSRLKRLSDRFYGDGLNLYKTLQIELEPRWFPLLKLLAEQDCIAVQEAANQLGVSQPAISQSIKAMQAKGLLRKNVNSDDSRKRLLSLSKKGLDQIKSAEKIWQALHFAIQDICNEADADVLKTIRQLEDALSRRSMSQRCFDYLNKPSDPRKEAVEIIPYRDGLKSYFKDINAAWIEDMFSMEEADRNMLSHPEKIINEGGIIWFASTPSLGIVGTCALMKTAPKTYELTKMGVLKEARGLGIGGKLLEHVVNQVSVLDIGTLYLLTNQRCAAAIHLYEKHGFVHDPLIMKSFGKKYRRCDVAMRYQPIHRTEPLKAVNVNALHDA